MKPYSSAPTFKGAAQISIQLLLSNGVILPGSKGHAVITFHGGLNVAVKSRYDEQAKFVEIEFMQADIKHTQKVELIERKSNLGKGVVLYFRCPVMQSQCRTLYFALVAGGKPMFKCRDAYKGSLFYGVQRQSKYWKANTRYFETAKALGELSKKNKYPTFKGKPTKRFIREQKLLEKQRLYNEKRCEMLISLAPKTMLKPGKE